ncbi:MAG: helix-turn-helix transcriptional regulator [Ruminococcus sp.]|nr:helix-turn-helix transcriptional regulator [Ruminococcus sp.]
MTKIPILFKIMEERKISAKKLSDDTGISTGNISDWKSGRSMPSGAKLQILSEYFDVSTDYLLGREEPIRQNQSDNTPLAGLSENARRIVELFDDLTPTQQGEIIGRAALLAEQNEAEYRKDSVG